MKRYLLILLFISLNLRLDAQVGVVSILPITSTTLGKFQKFEVGISLSQSNFINPFNPNEIQVYAKFHHVSSGAIETINAFGFQDFDRNESTVDPTQNNPCSINAVGIQDPYYLTEKVTPLPWRIRFSPDRIGVWNYSVYVIYNNQTFVSSAQTINVTTSNNKGNISIGENSTHFVYYDGGNESFIPLGVNAMDKGSLVFNRATYLNEKAIMEKLANTGGNTIRIFMSPENYGIEWNEDGLGKYFKRQNRAFNLDGIFSLAEMLNIKIQLVIISNHEFRNEPEGAQAGYNYWENNPYKILVGPNVPSINNQYDFFKNDDCFDFFKRRLRYIISR